MSESDHTHDPTHSSIQGESRNAPSRTGSEPPVGGRPAPGEPADYRDFIRTIIDEDLRQGKNDGRVATRFPPEPNGYLHIGHAKSICLNFGIATEFKGSCALRFDDTNPTKEEKEYIDAIIEDVRWLGFDWRDRLFYASDYFERMYGWGEHLIQNGKAYVCDLSPAQIREFRGTLTEPGRPSPYRNRTVDENLDLFRRMKAGEFPDGARVLRAKIDMGSPNLNLRDPVLYRILHASHPHAGNQWSIYPMYDYAHPLEDAIEGITHSICTLEFEDHRPLYDWFLANIPVPSRPRQIEFARLNLTYTVLSKRKLLQLVGEGHVNGWDDPRMPTISGLRRRGYTPESIRAFCERIGVAKRDSLVDVTLLENAVREDLNARSPRVMAVLRPLRIIIDNYPEGKVEHVQAINNPEDPKSGSRTVPFSREIFIEQDDFREVPPKKFYRLSPGKEIRLRYAYIIKCESVVKDPVTGEVTALHCTYDPTSHSTAAISAASGDATGATGPATGGAGAPSGVTTGATETSSPEEGRRVKGISHWVSAAHALPAEVRIYEHLFTKEVPGHRAEDAGSDSASGPTGANEGSRIARGARQADRTKTGSGMAAGIRDAEASEGGSSSPTPARSQSPGIEFRHSALSGSPSSGSAFIGEESSMDDEYSDSSNSSTDASAEEGSSPWKADINPNSVTILKDCRVEPSLAYAAPGSRWQFERQGYFCLDTKDSHPGALVFNRTVTLRDTWAKIEKKQQPPSDRDR